jgi:hypothetical protein
MAQPQQVRGVTCFAGVQLGSTLEAPGVEGQADETDFRCTQSNDASDDTMTL